jgi:hypothetical protein
MRTRMAAAAVALLVASVAEASAGTARARRTERRVRAEYQTPAPAVHPFVTACNRDGPLPGNRGCVVFPTTARERFALVEIHDATGLPVQGFIALEGELQPEWRPFCGSTRRAVPIGGTVTVIVYAYSPAGYPPCLGSATWGTVAATFSNVS